MPLNLNKIAVVDFETTGIKGGHQPVSIGCVILDPRKLTIVDSGIFYSKINIVDDKDVDKYGLDKTEKKALEINKLTLEEIAKSPPLKTVWKNFTNFINYHNPKKTKWDAPIFAGYNVPYDWEIVKRIQFGHLNGQNALKEKIISKTALKSMEESELAKAYKDLETLKEPWGFGPEWLFHPAYKIDAMQMALLAFESFREPQRLSLDSVKTFLGLPEGDAHNALVDVLFTAELIVRFLKIQRQVSIDTDFCTAGATCIYDKNIIDKICK